jgi:hypothetical protein
MTMTDFLLVEDREVNGTHKVRGVYCSKEDAKKHLEPGLHIEEEYDRNWEED